MEALHMKGIFATGTVRMQRKGMPPDLCEKKTVLLKKDGQKKK